ncbi:MAG: hypothetical protein DRO00_06655 [Thermoproteota archaeon]|nr:MAG: hypothetical protein DRO00_06655 [Candidatus Korarchaeota archaeon]
MNSEKLDDLKKWAALVIAWAAVFPALILFLDVWFAGRTQSRGISGPLTNLLAMFLAIMVFLMVDRISKLFNRMQDVSSLRKSFLMGVLMTLTGISLPSTTSTYARPSDALLMAFSFTVMSYSTLSVLWKRFIEAAENISKRLF